MRSLFVFAIGCLTLASCIKKDDGPSGTYNSKIEIKAITLDNVLSGSNVMGYLSREYIIATDTIPATEKYLDSFFVSGNNIGQDFHFNTPAKAKQCNIQMKFSITGGAASAASIGSFIYYKNDASIFAKKPMEFSGENNEYHSSIYTVTF